MNRKNKNALVLFTKAPRLGSVKTRLQPELTPEQSLVLFRAMVEDMVSQFDDVGFCDVKIFFYPANAHGEMKNWLGDQLDYFPQHGKDLGEKMHNAIAEMLNLKYDKVVLVGSDIPTLDSITIVRAFTNLDNYDVALGPSKDGGYYLIGMKKPYPALFQDMAWSTSLVLQQTIQKVRKAQLDIVQLEVKSDIDSYVEVVELWNYLKKQNMNGVNSYKSKTYQVLKKLFDAEYAFTQ